jgi:hypothetical protein
MRRLLILTPLLLLAPSSAFAQGLRTDHLTVGFSVSIKLCCGPGDGVGFGPALNGAHLVNDNATVGGFGWLYYYPSLEATRIGLGPQASFLLVGAELGPSVFLGDSTSVAASLTPFGSIGIAWAGIRLNFGARGKNPFTELVLGAGYPIGFGPPAKGSNFIDTGSGRPIRIRGERRVSGTRAQRGYGFPLRPSLVGSARARRCRAARWQRDAECEYSSIAAFEHVARQLARFGAPGELVRRCHAAARDEAKHARMCYGLASAYARRELGPRALDLRDLDARPTLAQLVYETVIDGCLGEAIAAAAARQQLAEERDPVVRKVLRAIARDEAEHARLAWSIVAWSLETSAIVRAFEQLTLYVPENDTAARVHRRVLGRLSRTIARVAVAVAA